MYDYNPFRKIFSILKGENIKQSESSKYSESGIYLLFILTLSYLFFDLNLSMNFDHHTLF